jgi:hypothetical protein
VLSTALVTLADSPLLSQPRNSIVDRATSETSVEVTAKVSAWRHGMLIRCRDTSQEADRGPAPRMQDVRLDAG